MLHHRREKLSSIVKAMSLAGNIHLFAVSHVSTTSTTEAGGIKEATKSKFRHTTDFSDFAKLTNEASIPGNRKLKVKSSFKVDTSGLFQPTTAEKLSEPDLSGLSSSSFHWPLNLIQSFLL